MIKGYKVFNPDWTCIDKQYTCPGKFEEDAPLCLCKAGMRFLDLFAGIGGKRKENK